mgnify:CR=1 FL=1
MLWNLKIKLWVNRRLIRVYLSFFWLVYRFSGYSVLFTKVIDLPFFRSEVIGLNSCLDFINDVLTGFWLKRYNPCYHRSILAVIYLNASNKTGYIKTGVFFGNNQWSRHIWVEDEEGVNHSDLVKEPAILPITQAIF